MTRLKVLLINPPKKALLGEHGRLSIYPPLGLAYLAAAIESICDVEIFDTILEDWRRVDENGIHGMDFREIAKKVKEKKPDIVGITGLSFVASNIHRCAEEIRKLNPKVKIVIGGAYATCSPLEVIKNENIDFAITGEGEEAFPELIEALQKNKGFEKVKGLVYRKNDKIIQNQSVPIKELDKIKFPARHLLDMQKYFEIFKTGHGAEGTGRCISMITSRGCPFNCFFCSASKITGKQWRFRSPENIIKEIDMAVKEYNITDIYFEDENMSLNPERMKKILALIIKRGYKINLHAEQGLRADTLSFEILQLMKKAGFSSIVIAPESGVQRVLNEVIRKNLDLKKVVELVKNARKIGISVGCYFVIGMPGETKEEILQTLNFAKMLMKLGVRYCTFNNAVPIQGTRMYDIAKEKGYLLKDGRELEDSILSDRHNHLMKTEHWTAEDINDLYKKAVKENARHAMLSKDMIKHRIKRLANNLIYSPVLTVRTITLRLKEFISGERNF